MHLSTTLLLHDGTTATVTELTVSDVRRLLAAGGDLLPETVLSICPGAITVSGAESSLGEAALAVVWEEFVALNRALFEGGKIGAKAGPIRMRRSAQMLDESCLTLIEMGHGNVWDYPYRLYRLATEMKR